MRRGNRAVARRVAGAVAGSRWLRRGRELWLANEQDHMLPLSRWDKLLAGAHLVLSDYAAGTFPPPERTSCEVHQAEIAYRFQNPRRSAEAVTESEMRKPFWSSRSVRMYLPDVVRMCTFLDRCGVIPPGKVLELGCGTGWFSEFLALLRYSVVGTTLSPHEVEDARKRIRGNEIRGTRVDLEFREAPMEDVDAQVADLAPFDAVLVYEALHHAHDWRAALRASFACLAPGGWLFVFGEPNILHTFVSHRVARLKGTHEIGMRRSHLLAEMRACGFEKRKVLRNRPGLFLRRHWIAAQK